MISKEKQSIEIIQNYYKKYQNEIIVTTSCGATSSVLINLISKSKCNIPIVFIDTGFLFPETMDFFYLLKNLYSNLSFIRIKNKNNSFINETVISNIEKCCFENKIEVLDKYIKQNNIKYWISGIRKEQSDIRKNIDMITEVKDALFKISPILNWSRDDIENYIEENSLPLHPLYKKGYESIGCIPCTEKGKNREGRWSGTKKIECGLHI